MENSKGLADSEILIRKAKLSEAEIILSLLQPQIDRGFILKLGLEEIKKAIDDFYVLFVDGELVTCAKFIDYGEIAEIGKVCTSKKYQGEGLAKVLIQRMKEIAPDLGFKQLFGLSVNSNMWRVFLSLGFREHERELLPTIWKESYDFSRPSKAFLVEVR